MPSTYTLNNGIELIATGEQSGTWGDTTNTNLELLDSALDGQVTVTLTSAGSSSSPNDLPITDGTASNGRNRMVVFNDGSDLGATAYVQLTPNDAEKIIYVRNDLSGSRSIILFQGTYNASNDYELPAGTTAVIFFDGAGSGAVAANVFNNAYFDSLRLGSVSVTEIIDDDTMATAAATNIATSESIKAYVDTQVGANNELSEVLANGNTTGGTDISVSSGDDITFADSSKAIFGAGSDLQIYHDGAQSLIDDAGTGELKIRSNILRTMKYTGETTALFTADGAVTLYYDNAEKLATTSTGVDITGTATMDGLTVDGDTAANGNLTITTSSNTMLDLIDTSASFRPSIRFMKDDGTATQLHMLRDEDGELDILRGTSSLSQARFGSNGDVSFYDDAGSNVGLQFDASSSGLILTNYGAGSTVGPDVNLFRDSASPATNDYLGRIRFTGNNSTGGGLAYARIETIARTTTAGSEDGFLTINTEVGGANTSRLEFEPSEAVFNETGADIDFRVESDTEAYALFVDASANNVGVKTSVPSESLHVTGNTRLDANNSGTSRGGAGNTLILRDNDTATASGQPVGEIEFYTSDGTNEGVNSRISVQATGTGAASEMTFQTGTAGSLVESLSMSNEIAIFNEGGNDIDFRVESDNVVNMLYVEAENDRVGIATQPEARFHIRHGTYGDVTGGIQMEGGNQHHYWTLESATHSKFSIGSTAGQFSWEQSNGEIFRANSSGVIINESAVGSFDFRVEGSSDPNLIKADAGNNSVGVGVSPSADTKFHIDAGSSPTEYFRAGTNNRRHLKISSYDTGSLDAGHEINASSVSGQIKLSASGVEHMRIDAQSSYTAFNETSQDMDFRVESDSRSHMFFVNAGTSRVGIGEGNPDGHLHITGDNSSDGATIFLQEANNNTSDTLGTIFFGNNADSSLARIVAYTDTNNTTSHLRLMATNSGTAKKSLDLKATEAVFNDNGEDIDFRVESDTKTHALFVNGANGYIGMGPSNPLTPLHITHNAAGEMMRLESTEAGNGYGPVIGLFRNSGSPADGDGLGRINFYGEDSSSNITTYASIFASTNDVSNGTEDGNLLFRTVVGGADTARLNIVPTEAVFNEGGSDLDFRVESDSDSHMFFVDAGNNCIGIGDTSPFDNSWGTTANTRQVSIKGTNYGVLHFKSSSTESRWSIGGGLGKFFGAYDDINAIHHVHYIANSETVFNEESHNIDFRVESDSNTHMLFVDAGNNRVSIGESTNAPNATLEVQGGVTMTAGWDRTIEVSGDSSSGFPVIVWNSQDAGYGGIGYDRTAFTAPMKFWVDATGSDIIATGRNVLELGKNGGATVFNQDSNDIDFRVESDASNHMIFVDAANNRLAFGFDGTPDKSFVFKGSASSASWRLYDDGTNWVAFDPVSSITRTVKFLNSGAGSLNVSVQGSLSKGSGSFRIDHPVASKADTHDLVHSFVEAPQADNIYRGKVDLVAGQATVNIDTVAGMTDGTFALLNREIQCFTSNETGWTAVRGSVSGNILTIEAQDSSCTDTISWLVIGERQDQHMYDTDWTDENGKVIVEPLKS